MHSYRNTNADNNISQCSVAKHSRCGGLFNDSYVVNLLMGMLVKKFPKWVNIPKSYDKKLVPSYSWTTI